MTNYSPTSVSSTSENLLVDPFFHSIVKRQSVLLIWRVESLQLKAVPRDSFGVFYKADTYLIYNSSFSHHQQQQTIHVHLWIGAESATDEQGIGAFKMVELDDYLGGYIIQHRECQGYESQRFSSYFREVGGIKYLNSGSSMPLWPNVKYLGLPRLYHLKGKRNVRLNELNHIDWSSLNRYDSFIIDMSCVIFVWNGRNGVKYERLQAINTAKRLRDERGGIEQCNVVIIEDGQEKELSKVELQLFETKFPLKEKVSKLKNDLILEEVVTNLEKDTIANSFSSVNASYLKLYKCCDARDEEDGTIKIKIIEQKTAPLYREDLNSQDSFIIDNGKCGIWIWIGKKSNGKERHEAMRNALGFLQAKGFDERQQSHIKVTRVIDGGEPNDFKALFNRWSDNTDSKPTATSCTTTITSPKVAQIKLDTNVDKMVDDGKSFAQVWYIKDDSEFEKLPTAAFGTFHSSECYIIHYKYSVNSIEKHILYYWIGRKSTPKDQLAVALKTTEMDTKEFDDKAMYVRVKEGKESNHFMHIFNGRITIYLDDQLPENYMLQVKSFGPMNTKALQIEMRACLLSSSDVFVICYKERQYFIWCGKGSTGDEREIAKSMVYAKKSEPQMVFECQERDDFWQLLGGKQAYLNDKRVDGSSTLMCQARLFEIINLSGKSVVTQVYHFKQEELNSSEIFILDAWHSIFIWMGSNSSRQERDDSERVAFDYLKSDPSQRGFDLPLYKIRQGLEPPNFTGFFTVPPWDYKNSKNEENYQEIKNDIHSKNQQNVFYAAVNAEKNEKNQMARSKSNSPSSLVNFSECPKYAYEQLIKPVEDLPSDILNESREVHLTNDDFCKIFKMDYEEFIQKPNWKQLEMKRYVRLF